MSTEEKFATLIMTFTLAMSGLSSAFEHDRLHLFWARFEAFAEDNVIIDLDYSEWLNGIIRIARDLGLTDEEEETKVKEFVAAKIPDLVSKMRNAENLGQDSAARLASDTPESAL